MRGKGHDRLDYVRPDIVDALDEYPVSCGSVPDEGGESFFVAVGNFAGGHRLSRRGVRAIVDGHLRGAALLCPGMSDHALRHTAAALGYHHSRDVRAVKEMLDHADPKTTVKV